MREFLNLEDNKLEIKYFLILMFLLFVSSLALRYMYVDTLNAYETFKWNNTVMLNKNDGYYYAKGAMDILSGINQTYSYPAVMTPLAKLTAFLAFILPISFENLILWMPAFFSSLIILPIMLLGRTIKQDMIGFYAALLATIGWSYYNRTMMGSYDTDILIVVLPSFVIYGIIYTLSNKNKYGLIFSSIAVVLSIYWHDGLLHVMHGILAVLALYTYVYERKNIHYYMLLTVFIIALFTLPIWMKISVIVILGFLFNFLKEKITNKIVLILLAISILLYLYLGGINWVLVFFNSIYFTSLLASENIDVSLKYLNILETINETQTVSFSLLAERISGSIVAFIVSIVGYILFVFRYKLMIISLPMVVLGIYGAQVGLRFTIFAVPFMALGLVYFVFLVSKVFENFIYIDKTLKIVKISFVLIVMAGLTYTNFKHIEKYIIPTVLNHDEVEVLAELNKIASNEDYTVSWWDYGYPIAYYTGTNVLIDGRAHDGSLIFPVSYILSNSSQQASANLARLDVEKAALRPDVKYGKKISVIMKDMEITKPDDFLALLNTKDIKVPKKTREIYFYFPKQMINIFPSIYKASNLNLLTGEKRSKPFYFISDENREYNNKILLGRGVTLDRKGAFLQIGKTNIQLNKFVVSTVDDKGEIKNETSVFNENSNISMIYRPQEHQFIVMDNKIFNSLFVQLYILGNYDRNLFERVLSNKSAKVYRLKI
ncbi:hypothetical protein JHD50_12590 [Sulfurimonas sp. MAG313]|nr:STT3 domain-containing protein [Sulfurimonas sp. MAG313]MDF1882125.1 hypothetical protein [Sulfurimonas sp. MAG313]